MATLPDLDETNISFLAYWNAIDQGNVSSITPDEVTSQTIVQSYTLYDNGLEGELDIAFNFRKKSSRQAFFRVKSDGWMIVYFDTSEQLGTQVNNPDDVDGPWDIATDWTTVSTDPAPTIIENSLERSLNLLRQEFSNSNSMTYNTSDVSLFNYEYPTATTLTNLSVRQESSGNFGFSYTSTTERLWHRVAGAVAGNSDNGNIFSPNDIELANQGNNIFAYDMIANNEAPNPDTEYVISHSISDFYDINHTNQILWK